jgi:hypothetical protein
MEDALQVGVVDAAAVGDGTRREGVFLVRGTAREAPERTAALKLQTNESILESRGEESRSHTSEIGRDADRHGIFPTNLSGRSLERVDVSDAARLAEIAAGDDELVRDERLPVELDGRPVRLSVVDPHDVSGPARESAEESIA